MPGNPSAAGAKSKVEYLTGRAVEFTAPFTAYLALLTGDVADNAAMTGLPEVATPGYARQPVTWGAATLARPSVISNSAVITYGPVTADMVTPVTYAVLVTTSTGTGGKILYKWQLDSPQQPVNGQALQIATTKLTISES